MEIAIVAGVNVSVNVIAIIATNATAVGVNAIANAEHMNAVKANAIANVATNAIVVKTVLAELAIAIKTNALVATAQNAKQLAIVVNAQNAKLKIKNANAKSQNSLLILCIKRGLLSPLFYL